MQNSLGLDDDLDPVEAALALEEAFALRFTSDEGARWKTVGDIFDTLHSRFAAHIGTDGACITTMTFYRLRRALRLMHPGVDFRPSTSLASYARSNAPKFLDKLEGGSGLRLPKAELRWRSGVGLLLCFGASLAVLFGFSGQGPYWLPAALTVFLVGVLLFKLDPKALPKRSETLGELARRAASLNYGSLVLAGAAVRIDGLWDAMVDILSEQGEALLAKSDIRRDTLILQK